MKIYKRILCMVLSVVLTAGLFANVTVAVDTDNTADRLSYDGVKYKMAQTAESNDIFSDSRKGLLLYTYGSGATATFNQTFSGEFEIETKAISSSSVPSLTTYTLNFTSLSTGENFSVGISDSGSETNAYVSVGEDLTGIYYATDYDDRSHGYTTSQNESNNYTKVLGANTTTIVFDPDTLEVKIKNVGGKDEYKTIWCLTEEVMDGKRYNHVLSPFDYYSVSVEFTSVNAGQKGELLVYSVNGEDYGVTDLPYVEPMVNHNLTLNAVVGQKYTLPAATLYGIVGNQTEKNISCTVFDEDSNEVASGKVSEGISFVPDREGTYYLYYSVSDREGAGTYSKLQAYQQKDVNCSIEKCEAYPESVGLNTTIDISARQAKSMMFIGNQKVYTDVVIKNGNEVVDKKECVSEDFAYTFEKIGTYTISWSETLYDTVYEETAVINVDENVPGIVGAEFKTLYDKGTKLKVPKATVYVGGKEYSAKAQIIMPSGAVSDEKKITLDEIGSYRAVYTYTADGEKKQFERTFQVDYNSDNIFIAGESTKIYYDDTAGNADMSGVQIEMTSKNSSATYAKTVDLSDNTKLDTLLELYVIPGTIGTADMTGFYVTLTDKLDPDNYISIRVVGGSGNMASGSYIRAKASGQPGYVGWYKNHSWDQEPYTWTEELETTMYHNKGGYTCDLDLGFNQTVFDISQKTLVLRYDAKEKALYSRQRAELVHDDSYRELLVVDFDDPDTFQNLWPGFADDSRVELSITPMSVSGTATFKILSVDGLSLGTETLADTIAPEVTVDYLGMQEIPCGKVGLPYPIFDIVATDNLCEDNSLVITKSVTHNGQQVEIQENAFTPTTAGTYQICYSVADGFGNVTERRVNVDVKADIPGVTITLDGVYSDKMTYGMNFYAPAFHGEGGSGKMTLRTYYIHDDKQTEFTGSFIPLDEGKYTVVCEVRDYLGQVAEESHTYNIEFEPEILFEEKNIVLPSVLVANQIFEFEEYIATYYEKVGGKAKNAECTIEVTDADGTRTLESDRLYTPKVSDAVTEATIRFCFTEKVNGKEIKKEIVRTVPIHVVENSDQFVTDYFLSNNAQLNAYNRYMTIRAVNTSQDVNLSFVRAISARNFSIVLKANEKDTGGFRSAYEKIRITLTDKNDPSIKVQFDIFKNGQQLQLSINNKGKVVMPGSLTTETQANVVLSYSNETYKVMGVENASLGSVTTTLAGEEFAGFTNGEVYVEIDILGVNGDSAIDLISLNNQTLLSAAQDTIDPELFVNGSYSGTFTSGSKVTMPTADAYDVLSFAYQPTITVTAPDGSAVKAKDGTVLKDAPADKEYVITVEQLGKYMVTYSASDSAGRRTTASKTVAVYDDELPTLTLKGKFPKSVNAGKQVKIKKYTIEDNGNVENVTVDIFYGTPTGALEKVKDGVIQTEKKGIYYVYFYLTDENGNLNVQTFSFEAK